MGLAFNFNLPPWPRRTGCTSGRVPGKRAASSPPVLPDPHDDIFSSSGSFGRSRSFNSCNNSRSFFSVQPGLFDQGHLFFGEGLLQQAPGNLQIRLYLAVFLVNRTIPARSAWALASFCISLGLATTSGSASFLPSSSYFLVMAFSFFKHHCQPHSLFSRRKRAALPVKEGVNLLLPLLVQYFLQSHDCHLQLLFIRPPGGKALQQETGPA